MPSPVASTVSANNAAPLAASAANSSVVDATLDFAALLFAQVESPAAPGLAIADQGTGASTKAGDDLPAATATQADPATLQALLAAVALPAPQTPAAADIDTDNLPIEINDKGRPSARRLPLSAPATNLATDSANPTPPTQPFAAPATEAVTPSAISAPPTGRPDASPANISDASGKASPVIASLPDNLAGSPAHPGISGHHPNVESDAARNAVPARIDTPLTDTRWNDDFGQKIVWLAKQDVQSAQISINPPNLGPIEVSLKLGPDQATAVFSSPHADVREALESALPRLREMFSGAGIQLGDAQVNAQTQQQTSYQPRPPAGHDDTAPYPGSAILSQPQDVNVSRLLHVRSGSGLVDTFA